MSIGQARREVERELGRQVPDKIWTYLIEKRFVAEYLGAVGSDLFELCKAAASLIELAETDSLKAPTIDRQFTLLSPSEIAGYREDVLSRLVAQHAEKWAEVGEFRNQHLPGGLLALDAVDDWVKAQVRMESPGGHSIWVCTPVPSMELAQLIKWDRGREYLRPPLKVSELTGDLGDRMFGRALQYANQDRVEQSQWVTTGGVLDKLRILSQDLSWNYTWPAGAATTFVLTGMIPLISSVAFSTKWKNLTAVSRIVLEVDPTVPPRELANEYRRIRKQVIGRRTKRLTEKHTRLAEFASNQPEGLSWSKKMLAWNKSAFVKNNPGWKYDPKQEKNFLRDAKEAIKRLIGEDSK